MKLACQLFLASVYAFNIIRMLYQDVNGKNGGDPAGFKGVMLTLLVGGSMVAIMKCAGLFSEFWE